MAILKFDAVAKDVQNPKMQQFLDLITPDAPKQKNIACDERPFVPEIAWAYFSALTTVLNFSHARLKVLKSGVENPQELLAPENAKKILKAALPHQARFIDEQDPGAYYYLIDEIEANLLNELRKILDGKEADQAATQRAKEIMSAINEGAKQARGDVGPEPASRPSTT
jgi:hypothetical protein